MKRVLVIDDTKNIRILLSTCLELRGYEVITADNGLEALNIINNTNEAIDLIFLDIRMPGISGTEVLKNIKEARMSCPVVIMTAFATVKNAIECTKLGAVVYLQKPFSPDRINIVLDEIESKSIPNKNESNIDLIMAEARRLLDQNDMDKYNKIHELLKKVIGMDPYNKEVYLMISQFNGLIGNKVEERRFQDIYNLFN
ncbi:response regulator [Clostridium tertium]|jgi:DNA-binding NtrC family response regulator|uniref:response regulator n=1 Tax=Clostridium TaxID=1485 RepID=UPI000BE404EA|nr:MULTISPECIES: response regulator [Clostridium]MBS5308052.1 response regulator [Clostridium sp.]MBU6136879.1 response regulator [Clostridium tertium]MDB1922854.1 response regulator [Clostridium tertium]MDB1925864.1 response regulator [Clostridium tertium]MDB1929417.1 response regulator [Clostridium tertium]